MIYRRISPIRGDETATYTVTDYKATTVGEFIDELLKEKPGEWGFIELRFCRCEYRYGKLKTELPKELMPLEIKSIEGNGGWSRMDYLIEII